MAQNLDAARTNCPIFKDIIPRIHARAAIAGQTTRLLLDLRVRLEVIQKLDEFLNDIPGINTEVARLPLMRLKEALVELDAGGAGNRNQVQWLSDDWALHTPHVHIVQDLAELSVNFGHVFRRMASVLKTFLPSNNIKIHTFYNDQDDSIISLIIETRKGGVSWPISPAAKNEKYSRMHLKDVASCSDTMWEMVVEETSSDWRSALAEMLHIQACRIDIGLDDRRLCKTRLRSLVRTYGVLPFSFHVSGLEIPHRPVSSGGFSDIYKGNFNKEAVCIKVLRIFTVELQLNKIYKELAREVLIWKELSHPNVLPLLGIDLTIRKPSCCLVSPWMKNGNVMAFLERYPDFNKLSLVRDIVNGLEYMHDLDPPVVHGDIKGANILINDGGQACLADFGLALAMESQALSTSSAGSTRGNLRWLAPEILDSSRKAECLASPTKRDIYAFGCTILEVQIYTGGPPFPNLQDIEVIHHVVTKREHPEIPSNAVAELKDLHPLLKRCWINNPRRRPNTTEISNILRLEPLEWKKAVDGLTSSFSMFRKLSAPSGRSRISPTPQSEQVPVKILLLGSSQSGKSTLLKQFGISGVHDEFKSIIFSNTVEAMRKVLERMPQLDITVNPRNDTSRALILRIPGMAEMESLSREVSQAIKRLSLDPGVRKTISSFGDFELSDSAEYFFDSIERLAAENYVPTTEDILRLRVKTTGIYERKVDFDGQTLIICDTGGERCERRKWIHCFSGTTAVFFLVALNDYQKSLTEDESINRMRDNLVLWRSMLDAKKRGSFASATFILLFNKLDLFFRDFQVEPFSEIFPDYITWKMTSAELFAGSAEALKALAFLRLQFLGNVHGELGVYSYELSATDAREFRDVWEEVKEIIL
ncbi:Kinase-like protein [Mycena sanguinolenta]|uniref:Kinase-like protein n=1 Tax=Mycena sanguinolenta TaxID=230812 RepID=A0A8H6Z2I0_9AGAR|nr:Kinase-like protein [Mycena sanguinolenta]